jgi:repressor LexA
MVVLEQAGAIRMAFWLNPWEKTMNEKPATERQQSILAVIRAFIAERGYPPSVREIGERVGLSSSSTIHAHLKALEKRGMISRNARR